MLNPKRKIAILGTRGIPARYGGFETFAEQLSVRLVQRGHEVTVYGRRPFCEKRDCQEQYRGVRVRILPTIMHKYLETPLHGLVSFLDALRQDFDVLLVCNAANSPFSWLLKLRALPFAVNVDGIERERSKWNALGRLWYLLGEHGSIWFATRIVADAEVIAQYYRGRYGVEPAVIAYGALATPRPAGPTLAQFGLTPGNYILYVSRLEPENNALGVIEAYNSSRVSIPLVIVGDAPYAEEYKERLRQRASPGVVFTGFQFEEAYEELRTHCMLYVQATEVGGTHPALVEGMAYKNCIIANDTPENREVLADAGLYYAKNNFSELATLLSRLVVDEPLRLELGRRAGARAQLVYTWEKITDQYEKLFEELLGAEAQS